MVVFQSNQVGCNFRVGFGLQFNTRVFNFFPEGGEVFNDAVVDDGDFAVVGQVRVSINIVGLAVRCPAGVPNFCGAGEVIRTDVVDSVAQVIQLSCFFLYVDGAPAVEDSDPRGVIPPVFHPLKSRKGDVEGLFTANVTDNSTHGHDDTNFCRYGLLHPPHSGRYVVSSRRLPRPSVTVFLWLTNFHRS